MLTGKAEISDWPETVYEQKAPRLLGYDVARALAIVGMIIVNFKVVLGADQSGTPWLIWMVGLLEAIGRLNQQSIVVALISAMCFFSDSLAFALFWRQYFKQGPLEWAMHAITK